MAWSHAALKTPSVAAFDHLGRRPTLIVVLPLPILPLIVVCPPTLGRWEPPSGGAQRYVVELAQVMMPLPSLRRHVLTPLPCPWARSSSPRFEPPPPLERLTPSPMHYH